MRLVQKNKPGQPYVVLGTLNEDQESVLRRLWRGERRPEVLSRLLAEAGKILSHAKERGAWIACDCLGDKHRNPPVLSIREYRPGKFALDRETGRAEHASDCVFHWEEGELGGGESGGDGSRRAKPVVQPSFLLYRTTEKSAAVHGNEEQEPHRYRSPGERLDPLARRLFYLLEMAGLNVLNGPPDSIGQQMAALRQEAAHIPLMGEIMLGDVLWTRADWLYKGWAKNALTRLRDSGKWPRKVPLQGFLLVYAQDVMAQTVTTADGTLHVEGDLRKPALDGMEARAPYLALLSVKLRDDGSRFEVLRGYAHPVLTKTLFPVDSNLEREAAKLLLWAAGKAWEDRKQRLVIEKPLHDIPVGQDGEGCRPDFLVRAGNRTLVIETMGSHDPEYRERKARTHRLMAQLGELYLDERAGSDVKEANRALASKVFQFSGKA